VSGALTKHSPTGKSRRRKSAVLPDDPRYCSASEFARQLNIGRTTLWRLMKAGRVNFVRISPTLVRIHTSEIQRLGDRYRRRVASED
jgi:excisionase family DNA binding protein